MIRFNLKWVLIFLTGACAVVAFRQVFVVGYRRQIAAADRVRKLNGIVESRPGEPAWLARFLDKKEFRDVYMVHLEGRRLEDDDLLFLRDLPRLRRLYLARTKVSNKGLVHLQLAKQLRRMSLWRTNVNDEGLVNLVKLDELEALDLQHNPRVTDAGLKTVSRLRSLKWLNLKGTNVTREGVERLIEQKPKLVVQMPTPIPRNQEQLEVYRKLQGEGSNQRILFGDETTNRLTVVAFTYRQLNLSSLSLLSQLDECPTLQIGFNRAEKGAIAGLNQVKGLKTLQIYRSKLNPEFIDELIQLKRLEEIILHFATYEDSQFKRLQEQLPNCKIVSHHRSNPRPAKPKYSPRGRFRSIPQY